MVIFFIGCFKDINTGRGGHYYSLLTMAESIGVPYQIFVVGDFFPPAYEGRNNLEFINLGRFSAYKFKPGEIDCVESCAVVHAYDSSSAVFASKFAAYFKVPLVVTKAGGNPLGINSVVFDNMVVFHRHDIDLLRQRKCFKPKNLALIPNRVAGKAREVVNRASPFPKESQDAIKILRVARVGRAYADSILQAYQLFNKLEDLLGKDRVFLSVVGYVQDEDVIESLKSKMRCSPNVNFYNTPEYYKNASELIAYADIIVGAGRSFMEGMLYNKFVFFPVAGSSLPCFSNPDSYNKAFYKNFSPRVSLADGIDPEKSFDDFLNVMRDPAETRRYFAWSRSVFRENHDVKVGADKLHEFYKHVNDSNVSHFKYMKYYFWSVGVHCLSFVKKSVKVKK